MQKLILIIFLFLALLSCKPGLVESSGYNLLLQNILDEQVPVISVAQLEQLGGAILLDSRSKEEFDVSHISKAIFVGFDDFDVSRVANLDKSQPIVVYCSVGYRSEKISQKLRNAGFKDVRNLYGGIFEWVNQGNEVVDSKGQNTSRIHPYSITWGIWLRKGDKDYGTN